jgi:hypothetical protein
MIHDQCRIFNFQLNIGRLRAACMSYERLMTSDGHRYG